MSILRSTTRQSITRSDRGMRNKPEDSDERREKEEADIPITSIIKSDDSGDQKKRLGSGDWVCPRCKFSNTAEWLMMCSTCGSCRPAYIHTFCDPDYKFRYHQEGS